MPVGIQKSFYNPRIEVIGVVVSDQHQVDFVEGWFCPLAIAALLVCRSHIAVEAAVQAINNDG